MRRCCAANNRASLALASRRDIPTTSSGSPRSPGTRSRGTCGAVAGVVLGTAAGAVERVGAACAVVAVSPTSSPASRLMTAAKTVARRSRRGLGSRRATAPHAFSHPDTTTPPRFPRTGSPRTRPNSSDNEPDPTAVAYPGDMVSSDQIAGAED